VLALVAAGAATAQSSTATFSQEQLDSVTGLRLSHDRFWDVTRWQKADLERDKKFVAEQKLTEGADEVFVNGDSFIRNAKALEPVFKARMFAEVLA
jgi:hypothetical protein